MTLPQGKYLFVWNIAKCGFGVNMDAMADEAVRIGLDGITVKVLQGRFDLWGNFQPSNKSLLPGLIAAFHARGLKVRGYQYITGGSVANAQLEAAAAVAKVTELGLDGLEIDAEHEYKQPGAGAWATAYMAGLAAIPATVSVSLCSYRYPQVHPEFPWVSFLSSPRLDFVMPQVYWQGAHNPDAQLVWCLEQYDALTDLPVFPTGSAYCEWGWCASPAEIEEFDAAAQELDLPGVSFWSWEHAFVMPGMWDMIASLDWGDVPPPPPDPDPVPPPVPCPELPRLKVLTNNLSIRSAPFVPAWPNTYTAPPKGNLVGKLVTGSIVEVLGVHVENADRVWVRHALGWSAVVYGVSKHMVGV